jgi:hypothetical protein
MGTGARMPSCTAVIINKQLDVSLALSTQVSLIMYDFFCVPDFLFIEETEANYCFCLCQMIFCLSGIWVRWAISTAGNMVPWKTRVLANTWQRLEQHSMCFRLSWRWYRPTSKPRISAASLFTRASFDSGRHHYPTRKHLRRLLVYRCEELYLWVPPVVRALEITPSDSGRPSPAREQLRLA